MLNFIPEGLSCLCFSTDQTGLGMMQGTSSSSCQHHVPWPLSQVFTWLMSETSHEASSQIQFILAIFSWHLMLYIKCNTMHTQVCIYICVCVCVYMCICMYVYAVTVDKQYV